MSVKADFHLTFFCGIGTVQERYGTGSPVRYGIVQFPLKTAPKLLFIKQIIKLLNY